MVKIAINGFGRIGRLFLRAALSDPSVEVVAFNDLADAQTNAHLFKYDSTHGVYDEEVSVVGDYLIIGDRKIKALSERDPGLLPWRELGIDVVIEASGKFNDALKAAAHIKSGAKKVILTAPGKNEDVTIVMGVNEGCYDAGKHTVISNASCTTNALAPVAKVIDEQFGIESGLMTTIHSATNDQSMLDQSHKDLRRARTAFASIIPTTTGAAKAVSLVLPQLKGKLNGFAMRVPVTNVSVIDLTVQMEKEATAEEINAALSKAAEGELRGILGFSTQPLVSIDYNGCNYSSVVDGLSTMVCGRLAKIISWYDNEWGYSQRVLDLLRHVAKTL